MIFFPAARESDVSLSPYKVDFWAGNRLPDGYISLCNDDCLLRVSRNSFGI